MSDFRVYCQPPEREPSEIRPSADESHHLVAVNRAKSGDTVVAFDGRGNEWICELAEDAKHAAVLKVRFRQKTKPLPYEITLGQALPKGQFMDAIVRKATELGAARIVPLESERTIVHLEGDRTDRKIEKWQTAAVEAAKQCGNPFVPEILPVQSASAFMEASRGLRPEAHRQPPAGGEIVEERAPCVCRGERPPAAQGALAGRPGRRLYPGGIEPGTCNRVSSRSLWARSSSAAKPRRSMLSAS